MKSLQQMFAAHPQANAHTDSLAEAVSHIDMCAQARLIRVPVVPGNARGPSSGNADD